MSRLAKFSRRSSANAAGFALLFIACLAVLLGGFGAVVEEDRAAAVGSSSFAYANEGASKASGSLPATAVGPLRVSAANPRYFEDGSGRIVYLAGSHTWANLQDSGPTDPPVHFDYTAYLDFLEAENHNFFRLWAWEHAEGGSWTGQDIYFAPSMYERTGPGLANDGKPKFDLNRFNQGYFDRLRERVEEASERGMYVSVMLFDGWSVEDKGLAGQNPWQTHPYQRDNNINGIDGDSNGDGQGRETHTLEIAAVRELQEAYIRKMVDTLGDLDNVLYEVSNESHGESQAWQSHVIEYIKAYEQTKGKQHPVGMTVEWPGGDNSELFSGPADWVSPNNYAEPPTAEGGKVIVADTDHIWGIGGDRAWAWKSFTRGMNLLFMDPYNCSPVWPPDGCDPANATWVSLRHNLGYVRAYAERIDLKTSLPRPELASSSYALANESQYLVYLPEGGSVEVDMAESAGEFAVEWLNPETGGVTTGATVAAGDVRNLTAPFAGDAVVYLCSLSTGACAEPSNEPVGLYLSPKSPTTFGGATYAPADVLGWRRDETWSLVYDADLSGGVTRNVVALARLSDGRLLLVFGSNQTVPGAGTFTPWDVAVYDPATGNYGWYLDGSDVGLTTTAEKIDALALAPDGRLLISTAGAAAVKTPAGTALKPQDEDLIRFDGTLGANASGGWTLVFDGSVVPGLKAENVVGAAVEPASGDYFISVSNAYTIAGIKGGAKDVLRLSRLPGGGYSVARVWVAGEHGYLGTFDAIEVGDDWPAGAMQIEGFLRHAHADFQTAGSRQKEHTH